MLSGVCEEEEKAKGLKLATTHVQKRLFLRKNQRARFHVVFVFFIAMKLPPTLFSLSSSFSASLPVLDLRSWDQRKDKSSSYRFHTEKRNYDHNNCHLER